uniref:Uncharacterized protein n=1 Tax=Oryza sativa subsp. japonica TaxID=39947 RepID=Q2R0R7_ORYSJ|nr:hypothetical protein LOC_Os11g41659 [Oryza sativa Japonica Group]
MAQVADQRSAVAGADGISIDIMHSQALSPRGSKYTP